MARHLLRGAAVALSLVLLFAGCSSSSSDKSAATTTTAGAAPVTLPGVPVTKPDGTPVTLPDGTPVTTPGGVQVTTPNGTPVTRPDGTPVTTPAPPVTSGGQSTPTTQPPVAMRWKLALDLRTHPDQNPFPNYAGGAPVWSLRQSATLQRTGKYAKLTAYSPSFASGVSAWHGNTPTCGGLPAIGVAIVGPAKLCTATIPPTAAFMSPDGTHLAVVAWASPFTGNASIATGLADLDPSCGDGVSYSIDRGTAQLAQGVLASGGSKVLPTVSTHVVKGQSLYFVVGPGASGDASCDATQIQVTIDQVR